MQYNTAPTAASAEPTPKVKAIVELVLIPISFAAPASSLVARMALPILVLLTKSCKAIIMTTEVRMLRIVLELICNAPSSSIPFGNIAGMDFALDENSSCERFCRKMLTPIAVINREILGAPFFRSRLYASFSMSTPATPQNRMETKTAAQSGIPAITKPTYVTYAPTMMMSPWAKLISCTMPYTMLYPSATRA